MLYKKLLPVFFLFCIGIIPQVTDASNRPNALTVSTMAGGYLFEGSQRLKDRPFFSLAIGYNFSEELAVEGLFGYLETVTTQQPGEDVRAYSVRLDLLYHFRPEQRLVPYLAAGLGGISYDYRNNGSNEDVLLGYGLGLKYFLTENFALRADARHLFNFLDSDSSKSRESHLTYTAGLHFQFGSQRTSRPAPAMVEIPPAPPLPPPPAPPTPPAVPIVVAPTPPAQPEPSIPADSDGDGVPDTLDRCPATPHGLQVDRYGCPVPLQVAVEFLSGRTEIDQRYRAELEKIARTISMTSGKIQIEGHTDSVGSAAKNLELSRRRAENVRTYLIDHFNLPPERLTAVGFGASQPVADNSTQRGRAMNRRVLILFEP
jgi:OmpA-OmpF porin, OOP family